MENTYITMKDDGDKDIDVALLFWIIYVYVNKTYLLNNNFCESPISRQTSFCVCVLLKVNFVLTGLMYLRFE